MPFKHCTKACSLYFLILFESNVSQNVAAVITELKLSFVALRKGSCDTSGWGVAIAGVDSRGATSVICNSVCCDLVWNVNTELASCCCCSRGPGYVQILLINVRPRSLQASWLDLARLKRVYNTPPLY